MTMTEETFQLHGRIYSLKELRKLPNSELRRLMGGPKTVEDLAKEKSEQIKREGTPSIRAPVTPPAGGKPSRARAGTAPGGPPTVPPPGQKPPAPPPKPVSPALTSLLRGAGVQEKGKGGFEQYRARQEALFSSPQSRASADYAARRGGVSPEDIARAKPPPLTSPAGREAVARAQEQIADPGSRGYQLAELIWQQAQKDEGILSILDGATSEEVGSGGMIRRLALRMMKDRATPLTYDEALAAATRIASAGIVKGKWPSGMVRMPKTLDPEKMSPLEAARDALTPQVNVMGINRRGATMTVTSESPLMYAFRMADIPQEAASGLVAGLAQGKGGEDLLRSVIAGVRDGAIMWDAVDSIAVDSEWAKENPVGALHLKKLAGTFTLVSPDLTTGIGPAHRAARVGTRLLSTWRARSGSKEIISTLDEALAAINRGDARAAEAALRSAGRLESKQRKSVSAYRDAATIEEARLVEAEIDAGDPSGIANEELAKAQFGGIGTRMDTMHPAARRASMDIGGRQTVGTQEYRDLFALGPALGEMTAREISLRRRIARGQGPMTDTDWRELNDELNTVSRGIGAIKKNIEIRLQANKNVLARAEEVARGKPDTGASAAFRDRPETEIQRAVDAIAADAAEVDVVLDPEDLLREFVDNGKAAVPDVDKIRGLRNKVDKLMDDLEQARAAGVSTEKIIEEMRQATGELRLRPTKVMTAQELAELQTTLAHRAEKRTGLGSPSIRERGDMPMIGEERPTEQLERLTTGLEKWADERLGNVAALPFRIPSFLKSIAFGLDADSDLRHLPKTMQLAIKAGIRYVDQGASDYNALIREGDTAKKMQYLTGAHNVTLANGHRLATSGYDHIGWLKNRLSGKFQQSEHNELLTDAMDKWSRLGSDWARGLSGEESRTLAEALHDLWEGDEFLSEVFTTVIGRTKGEHLNPQDIELMETLLYYSGATPRNTVNFTGTSLEAATGILDKVRRLHGEERADLMGQIIAVFGNVDEAVSGWASSGVSVSLETQRSFANLLQGRSFADAAERARVLRVAEQHGLGPVFQKLENTNKAISGTDSYVPLAARQRMVEAVDRVLPRGRTEKGITKTMMTIAREAVQIWKTLMTRGGGLVPGLSHARPTYFHTNAGDRFAQLSYEMGIQAGLVNYTRQAFVELTSIPGVEALLRTPITKEARTGAFAEQVRDVLQAGGDRAASALNRVFGAAGVRIEVNQILDGVDDVIMVGDKAYTGKQLRRILAEEGTFGAFDNTQLKNALNSGGLATFLQNAGFFNPAQIAEMAESISVRERIGAIVGMMEHGHDPRTAARFMNNAYYDYATSVAKLESSSHALGLALTIADPYWAYTKNASRQTFDAMFRPEAAYKVMLVRRLMDDGADIATNELYRHQVDEYGVDTESLPEDLKQQYFTFKHALYEHYDGKVPEEVRRAARLVVSGKDAMYDDGRYVQLVDEDSKIAELRKKAGLHEIGQHAAPRPDKSAYRKYLQDRPTVTFTQDMSNEEIRNYHNSQVGGERSHLVWALPEDTARNGFNQIAFSILTAAAATRIVTAGPSGDRETEARALARHVRDFWDPARGPVIGGTAASIIRGPSGQGPRVSTIVGRSIEQMFPGTMMMRTVGTGEARQEVWTLPPAWRDAYLLSGLQAVDGSLKKYEGTPLSKRMGLQGELLNILSAGRGISVTEQRRSESAARDLPPQRYQTRDTITPD